MEYFCPKCGKIIDPEEFEFYKQNFSCRDCSQEPLTESLSKQYTMYLCSGCLSYIFNRDPNNAQWKKSDPGDVNQVISQVLKKELAHLLKNDSEALLVDFSPITEVPTKMNVILTFSGVRTEIDLIVKSGLCKNCNKMFSKRFDAVIQLRTIKMKSMKPHELLTPLLDDVESYVIKIQLKHPDQFISDIDEQSHGFDLKLSNKSVLASIQSYLINKYSFIIKTSKKLMGKNPNTGGDLYRTYLLLRYIPFQEGDVIGIKNDTFIVKKITANRIQLKNLKSNSFITRNFEYFEKNLIELKEV
jgi:NMD protein affecting ribosome stability and mRNA decay